MGQRTVRTEERTVGGSVSDIEIQVPGPGVRLLCLPFYSHDSRLSTIFYNVLMIGVHSYLPKGDMNDNDTLVQLVVVSFT